MKRLALLLIVLLGLTACSSAGATTVSPSEFQNLAQQPGVVVLDVRTPAEFAQGHLPDAINMDVESADFPAQIAGLDKNATYAVYCRSANRSKVAMEQMSAAGFENVQDLEGGIVSWQAQGLPVVR
ncbi:MAG: rhodanese-like domain-containing protein [Candidatus Nanopelagicales bacterium]